MKQINFLLFGLSILFTLFFYKKPTKFLENLFPKTNLKIRNLDKNKRDLVILTECSDFIFDKNNKNIEIIPKGKYGYSQDALWIKDNDTIVEVKIKKSLSLKISFYNISTDKVEINLGKKTEIINLGITPKGKILEFYPFKNSKIIFIYYIFYIILVFLIYKILCLIVFEKFRFSKEDENYIQ